MMMQIVSMTVMMLLVVGMILVMVLVIYDVDDEGVGDGDGVGYGVCINFVFYCLLHSINNTSIVRVHKTSKKIDKGEWHIMMATVMVIVIVMVLMMIVLVIVTVMVKPEYSRLLPQEESEKGRL